MSQSTVELLPHLGQVLVATSTVSHGNMAYRYGSEDAVSESRKAFVSSLGTGNVSVAEIEAQHRDLVRTVTEDDFRTMRRVILEGEVLMTRDPNIALFLLTADCLPVTYIDTRTGALALAHLGWRPIACGLAAKVVERMGEEYGTMPEEVRVVIGPGIGEESYAFPEVTQTGKEWAPYLHRDESGLIHINLKGYVKNELVGVGVLNDSIETSPIDTGTDVRYFSHYRATRDRASCGRMATIAVRCAQ